MNAPAQETQRVLACLGHASRFRLVERLSSGTCCVTELAVAVGLSQSCTTRHLQALQRAGIVRGARDGKRVLYGLEIEAPRLKALIEWALHAAAPPAARHRNGTPRRRPRALAVPAVPVRSATPPRPFGPERVPDPAPPALPTREPEPPAAAPPDPEELEDYLL